MICQIFSLLLEKHICKLCISITYLQKKYYYFVDEMSCPLSIKWWVLWWFFFLKIILSTFNGICYVVEHIRKGGCKVCNGLGWKICAKIRGLAETIKWGSEFWKGGSNPLCTLCSHDSIALVFFPQMFITFLFEMVKVARISYVALWTSLSIMFDFTAAIFCNSFNYYEILKLR